MRVLRARSPCCIHPQPPSHLRSYDVGVQEETPYLVIECVSGETLAARLQRGKLDLAGAVLAAEHIAGALEAAHPQGIVTAT